MFWSIISWFLIGLLVGAVARLLIPGRQSLGILGTSGLGVLGALLGGFISWAFTGAEAGQPFAVYAWPGWLMSILGAVIILWIATRHRRIHHR